ncbi:unnamed protein product [Meloidogyne enterolobii]|uniref:Uncharacterized protein n=1 Tax=Meloidogyne enterolobii TaxID=390850 RepID=A0ACB0YGG9_MELEN
MSLQFPSPTSIYFHHFYLIYFSSFSSSIYSFLIFLYYSIHFYHYFYLHPRQNLLPLHFFLSLHN